MPMNLLLILAKSLMLMSLNLNFRNTSAKKAFHFLHRQRKQYLGN
jgi:hypothetical protein